MKPIATLLAFCLCMRLEAQTPEAALDSFAQNRFSEKALLCFLKKHYVAGETLSFKAYVLNGYQLSLNSTNLYTELYDSKKNLLDKNIVPLFSGSGEGSFTLPASLAEGVYYLRAYTTYMLNFDPAFQFIRPIAVYNPVSGTKLKAKSSDWVVVAKPEGGIMFAGGASKIGVRIVSSTGLPQEWSAGLYEAETGQLVGPVEKHNTETGSITFFPEEGKKYVVKAKDQSDQVKEVQLPENKNAGTSLKVSVADNKVAYQLAGKGLVNNGAGYRLVATLYDQLVSSVVIKNFVSDVTGLIDVKDLPSGILHITVFTPANEPVNERLCFIHPAIKKQEAVISLDSLSFAPKAFNRWQLKMDSTSASYALSVQDAAAFEGADFLSQLYLQSDFMTPVHEGDNYFKSESPETKAALDALLITETWRRFLWKDVLKDSRQPLVYEPENYLSYTGVVRKGQTLQPLRDIDLIFRQADSSTQFLQTKTNKAGTFTISDAVFADTIRVFFQAGNRKFLEKDLTVDFELKNKFYPYTGMFPESSYETIARPAADTVPAFVKKTTDRLQNERLLQEKAELLEEVVIKTKVKNAKQELDKKYSSPLLNSLGVTTTFDFVNDPQSAALGYSNILQWLRGRVSGLSIIRGSGGRTEVQLRGNRSLLGSSAAQIYVDDLPVDADYLNGFPVANIAMIKVVKGASLAGPNGAVAIYTKRGGEGAVSQTAGLPSRVIYGYKKPIPFFQPDYSITGFRQTPDQRDVLFKILSMNASTEISSADIRFYNNDIAKKFVLVVIGFSPNGSPVYTERTIQL